ncbi:MAG: phage major capsid protein [Trueperaceae bacterium]
MPPELASIEAELKQAVAELRSAATAQKEADGLQQEQLAKINAEIDRLSDQQAELIKRSRTPNHAPGRHQELTEVHQNAAAALNRYIRRGENHMTAADREAMELYRKELSVDSDPDGGYLVTPAVSSRIITRVEELNPIRQLATVETISTDSLEGLVDQDEADAGWVSERQARPATNTPKLGTWSIPVHEIYAAPRATQKLLDDAAINIEAWLSNKVARKFAAIESVAFLKGTGAGQPKGLLSYPAGTTRGKIQQVPTGAAAGIAAEGIVNIVYALKSAYLTGSVWLMNRATEGAIRTIRDDSGASAGTGQFMWAPGFGGAPATLMGYPIYEAPGFDNVSAGNLVAAFGNIREAYTVVDRQGIRVLRDPYTAKPFVELYTTKRVGGDVLDFDAVKLFKVAAS